MQEEKQATRWSAVLILFFAGVMVAGQVGKAPVALPLIRTDLNLSLTAAALVVSLFALLGAIIGLPAGALAGRLGMRMSTVGGLALLGLGSLIGAAAPSGTILLASRVVESVGYLAIMIGAPTLIRHFSSGPDRDRAMVLWSTFMPVGSSLVMFGAPFVLHYGWRELWMLNAALLGAFAIAVWFVVPPRPPRDDDAPVPKIRLIDALANPGISLPCFIYLFYTFLYFALTGLMPTYLVEYKGASVTAAGTMTALMIALIVLGNVLAGILMRFRVPLWIMLLISFLIIAALSPFIFSDFTPLPVIVVLASVTLVFSAMVPGVIWAALPRFSNSVPELGVGFGLLIQTSNIGQLAGASAMGAWAEHFGWSAGWAVMIFGSAFGIILSLRMRKIERGQSKSRV